MLVEYGYAQYVQPRRNRHHAPSDVDDWQGAMNSLADDEPVSWLGNRCPEIKFGLDRERR